MGSKEASVRGCHTRSPKWDAKNVAEARNAGHPGKKNKLSGEGASKSVVADGQAMVVRTERRGGGEWMWRVREAGMEERLRGVMRGRWREGDAGAGVIRWDGGCRTVWKARRK